MEIMEEVWEQFAPQGGILLVWMWQNQTQSKGLGVSEVTREEVPSEESKTLTLLHTGINVAQLLL